MPNDSPKNTPTSESAAQDQPTQEASIASPDRAELLTRARGFLTSPQVRLQDPYATRTFLTDKGLTPAEIDQLLRELPPSVPPRTYPALPPSNLPNLLAGVARIFTWLIGTSAIVLYVYYRYLLPRLAQSYQARLALRKHQSALIARLAESASALKAIQAESYKDLPRTIPVYEDSQSSREGSAQPGTDIPDITILRCALEELGRSKTDGTSTEELFRYLESKFSWLGGEEGVARQSDFWNQLNACPLFVSSVPKPAAPTPLPLDHSSQLLWKYIPPPPPTTSSLLASLVNLQAALPRSQEASASGPPPTPTISARQRTLQVLSDFTGYITTQTYTLGLPSIRGTGVATSGGSPVEDELRREIRALKGLVLNRRSFLPSSTGASGFTSTLGSS
ncbi:hypothetical protein JVT61DRAFT_12897 [Boletus reticuloceps]|uniref:Peroxisomal membrane protein PEX14 n=1 Tax=Boletus reticuloceps TaxID=495285 RepID=A0A8I2YVX9_9AGAM|nr:hypothetical protein JVT61DRAFT_12897 [Boletus reticuloceps]